MSKPQIEFYEPKAVVTCIACKGTIELTGEIYCCQGEAIVGACDAGWTHVQFKESDPGTPDSDFQEFMYCPECADDKMLQVVTALHSPVKEG